MRNKKSHSRVTMIPPPLLSQTLEINVSTEWQNIIFGPWRSESQKNDNERSVGTVGSRLQNRWKGACVCVWFRLCVHPKHDWKGNVAFIWNVCQKLPAENPPIPPFPQVYPTRLEKQVSIQHLPQQPLHTDSIPDLKPSTWHLINNWLTCFSGEPDDLHQSLGWLLTQQEPRPHNFTQTTTLTWRLRCQTRIPVLLRCQNCVF